jgi:hypothetical protein
MELTLTDNSVDFHGTTAISNRAFRERKEIYHSGLVRFTV